MVKSVAILGSCVSRDNFNSRINPDYKNWYNVDLLQNQSSLISIMSPPRNFDPAWFSDQDDWSQWCITTDLNKEFLTKLKAVNPDLIIVDLFGDARFGVIEYDGEYITHNDWRIPQSGLYPHLTPASRITLATHWHIYNALFREAVRSFSRILQEEVPDATIILNSARAVTEFIDKNNKRHKKFHAEWLNKNWENLDAIFMEEVPNAIQIRGHTDGAASSHDHIWGSSAVHYEKAVYRRFLVTLNDALDKGDHHRQSVRPLLLQWLGRIRPKPKEKRG